MNRLSRLIEQLSIEDLKLIQKDLEAGNLDRLVRHRLAALEQRKQCPTCGSDMSPANQKYAIEFGPRDLRQKAYFDEYDCLDYFLRTLRANEKLQSGSATGYGKELGPDSAPSSAPAESGYTEDSHE